MIWKKLENRSLYLIELLERKPINEDILLDQLKISKKTLSNDIKQINKKLEHCAFINIKHKEISLYVYDYKRYKKSLNKIRKEEESFNNEKYRLIYIIKNLFENKTVTMGDLSFEMIISKTTLNKDIEKVNKLMDSYNIRIAGRPNVGIGILGEEIDIRNFVIENCYNEIFRQNKDTRLVSEIIRKALSPYLVDEETLDRMKIFLNVSIVRIRNNFYINRLDKDYSYNLKGLIKDIGEDIKNRVEKVIGLKLSDDELKFITVPLRGMRTPLIITSISDIEIGQDIQNLISEIFTSIKRQMDLDVDLGKVTKDFNYHIYFLLNRIKLDYKIDNSLNEEIKKEYRVAYKMAEIAAKVIENKLEKTVNESEKSYLASYFQIYIVEKLDLVNKNAFKIAIFTTDEINDLSLKRKLKAGDINDDLSISIIDDISIDLSGYDLLITDRDVDTEISQISGKDIYKISKIRERIEDLREKKNMILNNRFLKSVFLNNLDEEKLFLIKGKDFKKNLYYMLDSLIDKNLVDEDFKERIIKREKISSTIFSRGVAFPHTKSNKLSVALGINEKDYPNLIFLVGVPENLDEVLVKLYDEIVTIANDDKLVEKISKIKSYPKLMEFFIKETELFR
ncbi:PRD domain-containing protein [Anaerococcus sp. AGMB00486]|uniref:PRD domain-containing protein n=2 Tax=Anaerococcus TaxID=165779 RepID=A0ABX2NBK5_9FIRM|nr:MULTISPECIES: PRD domain-containing protein [Anaerococcus]MDY3006650.1 PRD domain-containing protein [Anaerococcus porci]MSS78117.1 PRD domain-containing protein [Anaerococcus porci]NVF12079.1 PRD domain-containing protein [Anaerococcus faecalis]